MRNHVVHHFFFIFFSCYRVKKQKKNTEAFADFRADLVTIHRLSPVLRLGRERDSVIRL